MTARTRSRSLLTTVGVALALSVASFANVAPAKAATSTELSLWRSVNHARTTHHEVRLYLSPTLSYRARRHSALMARRHRLFHTSPLSSVFSGFRWTIGGENVGYASHISTLYRAFMASTPHRANILRRAYRATGIGCVWRYARVWCTQEFMG